MGNEVCNESTPNKSPSPILIGLDTEPMPSPQKICNNNNTHVVQQNTGKPQQKQSATVSQVHDYMSPHKNALTTICRPDSTLSSRLSSKFTSPLPFPDTPDSGVTSSFNSFSCTPISKSKNRRHSSFSQVCNGITGSHISSRICKIAAKFWQHNIATLQMEKQLEIARAIFFGALSNSTEMKEIMNSHLTGCNKKIEVMSYKYLDMIGWLIRHLIKDDIDLYSMLTKLGIFHQRIGVKINHFGLLLQSMHEAFAHFFPQTFTIEVKYALDEIFSLAAQIMTGQDLKGSPVLNDITKTFENEKNIEFLSNVDICIKSKTGKEYLYRYLQQHFCDEIVIFLQLLTKFKLQTNIIQKFMVVRDIIKTSIEPSAYFALNISYECRNNTLTSMQELQQKVNVKEPFNIDTDFFSEVEYEIYRLISQSHWTKFVRNIQLLHSKSFGL